MTEPVNSTRQVRSTWNRTHSRRVYQARTATTGWVRIAAPAYAAMVRNGAEVVSEARW